MKFEKSPLWKTFEGGLSKKPRLAPSKTQQKIHFNISKHSGYCRKSRTSGTKKRTKKQDKQRLRFQYCDCLYKYLKRLNEVLYEWFSETHTEQEKKKGLRSIFMSECLKFELEDLLRDYLCLEPTFFAIYEKEDSITIMARIEPSWEAYDNEDLYLPNPYRGVR